MSEEGIDEELLKLVSKTVRRPKKGWETFIANKIALALYSPPLEEIRHIAECIFALERSERVKIGISDDEVMELNRIYALALTFSNKYIENLDVDSPRRYIALGWPFHPDKMDEWFDPWVNDEDTGKITYRYWDVLLKEIDPSLEHNLYNVALALYPPSAYSIETRFLKWALPKTMRILRKLLRIVSPSTLQEAIQVHRGVKRESPKP